MGGVELCRESKNIDKVVFMCLGQATAGIRVDGELPRGEEGKERGKVENLILQKCKNQTTKKIPNNRHSDPTHTCNYTKQRPFGPVDGEKEGRRRKGKLKRRTKGCWRASLCRVCASSTLGRAASCRAPASGCARAQEREGARRTQRETCDARRLHFIHANVLFAFLILSGASFEPPLTQAHSLARAPRTHTRTHTHTPTHTRTHKHTHLDLADHLQPTSRLLEDDIQGYISVPLHTRTHTHTHTKILHFISHAYTNAYNKWPKREGVSSQTHLQRETHVYTYVYVLHQYASTHADVYAHTHTCMHTHTHTHLCMHTRRGLKLLGAKTCS